MMICRLLRRIGCLLGGLLLVGSVCAQTVTYTFESPSFLADEVTPLFNRTPNVGSPTFNATFASSPTAGGLSISSFLPNNLTIGQVLYVPFGQQTLTVSLNQSVTAVALDFAVPSHGTLQFSSVAGNTSLTSGVVGGSFEGGSLTFSSPTSFTSFQVWALNPSNTQIEFAIDNLVMVVPEPGVGSLWVLGMCAGALSRRFRK